MNEKQITNSLGGVREVFDSVINCYQCDYCFKYVCKKNGNSPILCPPFGINQDCPAKQTIRFNHVFMFKSVAVRVLLHGVSINKNGEIQRVKISIVAPKNAKMSKTERFVFDVWQDDNGKMINKMFFDDQKFLNQLARKMFIALWGY